MKRTKLYFLIIVFALFIFVNTNTAEATTSGDYEYEEQSDGTIKITDYTGTTTNLTIPSTINGKTVTTLGSQSFSYNTTLQQVTIPSTVTTLEFGVFMFSGLTSATVPSTVTKMASGVFLDCTSLETLAVNANIDTLPNGTVMGCTSLTKLTLSSTITSLENQAIVQCTSLTDLSFLNNIEYIGQQCFMYCSSLTTVVIPASVKTIDKKAFDSSVTVDISNTRLTKIGNYYATVTEITLTGTSYYSKAYEVLDLVNSERAAEGLSALTMDEELLECAMTRAVETSLYFSHDRTNGLSCFSVSEKLDGENIASGSANIFSSASSAMSAWMGSPGHKSNILGSDYTSIGIGCFSIDGMYYWVQCFSGEEAETATQKSDTTGERSIYVSDDYISLALGLTYKTMQPGDKYQATITNKGYSCNSRCATWTSSDESVATVDSNGKITAIKNGKVTITATLGTNTKNLTVYVQQFEDVKETWYTSAINYCYDRGYMTGTTSTTFEPNTPLTRGMLVTILYKKEKGPTVNSGATKFSDVTDSSKYYYSAVKWASEKGIISGYDDGRFGPDDPITRQDVAVILRNYDRYKGNDVNKTADLSSFADASKVSGYANSAMQWAVAKKIITGNSNTNTLSPTTSCTRAEMASMMYKYTI